MNSAAKLVKKDDTRKYFRTFLHFYSELFDIFTPNFSDFKIDQRTFEVGGKSKGQRQLLGAEQGYIVKDDIEFGYFNVIPIWAFGQNY